jgi:aspartate dehydrogenase
MRLGLIGCGAIGGEVMRAARHGGLGGAQLAAVLVRLPRAVPDPLITHEPDAFFDRDLEVVVECAGHQAVRDHGIRCLESGADLVLTSIGALVDDDLRARLSRRRPAPAAGSGSPQPGSARSTSWAPPRSAGLRACR